MTVSERASNLTLAVDGAQYFPSAASGVLEDIHAAAAKMPSEQAGVRIHGIAELSPILVSDGAIGKIASTFIGSECRPVRAILFDKSAKTNWSLGWHQDRTICVKRRVEVDGYGPWTTKRGTL